MALRQVNDAGDMEYTNVVDKINRV